jgi:hypothetical protein
MMMYCTLVPLLVSCSVPAVWGMGSVQNMDMTMTTHRMCRGSITISEIRLHITAVRHHTSVSSLLN